MSEQVNEKAAMQILDRLAQLGVKASALNADSRLVREGDVFVAFPGTRADGRRFIADAVSRGAAAVLWEHQGFAWDEGVHVTNIEVDNLQDISGYLAHFVFGRPSEKLRLVGITGTNGKTSVSQWIAQAFGHVGRRCAVIGTLGNGFPIRPDGTPDAGALAASANTTPDAIALHRSLAEYLAQGATATAMEVSSIGLDQGRVNGARFDVAVFTNLTRDHLDYHRTMDAYAAAKELLFAMHGLRCAVLNLDDAFGRHAGRKLAHSGVERIGYTQEVAHVGHVGHIAPEVTKDVDWLISAENVAATARGLRFEAVTPAGRASIEAPLIGHFNVSNLLAVLATLLASGVALTDAAQALSHLLPPPGRMQMQGGKDAPLAVVDYAHTPDALEQALRALRPTAQARDGKLWCVFGCGGERDPGKRPLMGEVAMRCADRVVITSDNPRGEDPGVILADIVRGAGANAEVIEDRAAAIAAAIAAADAADVVLIAGKGHEPYQEVRGAKLPFSDAEQAAAALAAYGSGRS